MEKQVRTILIWAVIAGALGGVFFDRILVPKLSSVAGFGWLTKLSSSSQIIITRNEQVVLNEGANLVELAKQTSNITVSLYRGQKPNLAFAGLGIVMTSDGLIFTSKSVIGNNNEVTVVTNDGMVYPGLLRALDPKTDLAVITIPAKNLSAASFGSALSLQAGQRVVSVGIANREYERRINSGIVTSSVLNNKSLNQVFNSEVFSDSFTVSSTADSQFVGAPMVNLEGQLVGMVSNFSGGMVTAENLKPALDSYLQTGKIVRARLGVQYWYLSTAHANLKNISRPGVLVLNVDKNSPASKALLRVNDLIFEVAGESLEDKSFEQLISRTSSGEMKVGLLRAGKELEIKIILEPTK